jgi:hypothetical protein
MKNALIALAVLSIATPAAAQLSTRCWEDDQLGTVTLAQGRNAWSKKCGYISQAREDYLNSVNEYQVYTNGCYAYPNVPAGSNCTQFVPADGAAACITGLVKLGSCVTGCYTPDQRLTFNGEFQAIDQAYINKTRTVTALDKNATMDNLIFGEQAIYDFIAGDTNEYIYVLRAADRQVQVTSEHPMVRGDGQMVKAKTLKAGDILLGADGSKLQLESVSTFFYHGTVWNVRPESRNMVENVLNAEGFLTGSVRFQNEWADTDFRLSIRDEVDVGTL